MPGASSSYLLRFGKGRWKTLGCPGTIRFCSRGSALREQLEDVLLSLRCAVGVVPEDDLEARTKHVAWSFRLSLHLEHHSAVNSFSFSELEGFHPPPTHS